MDKLEKSAYEFMNRKPTEVEKGDFKFEVKKSFSFSPFSIAEIQYIRGLIMSDKLAHHYELLGMKAKIDRKTSMHDFTENIMKKLDQLEND